MSGLRIGVEAWGLGSTGAWSGMGQYAASLLRWLPRLTPVEVVAYGAPGEARPEWLSDTVAWRVPTAGASRWGAISTRLGWLPSAVAADGIDVFHVPGVHVRPSSPPVVKVRCPLVVTVHDVIPRSYYGSSLPVRNRIFYSWNLRRAVRADRVLTVSLSSKDDIVRFTDLAPERVEVVGSVVEFEPDSDPSGLADYGIEGTYLLYAGSYEPRKNLLGMLDAFERYVASGGRHLLVAVTEPSSGHAPAVHAVLDSLACRDRVRLIHSVPDRALRRLYTNACAVVFPSRAEGFGLPPIQAAACGVPAVVSDLPALRETVGEIAVMVRPDDPASLCEALAKVTTDSGIRARAAGRGPELAARYSPDRFVSDHLEIYQSCHELCGARP